MTRLSLVIAAIAIAVITARASAGLRPRYEDAQVVEQSELIAAAIQKRDIGQWAAEHDLNAARQS